MLDLKTIVAVFRLGLFIMSTVRLDLSPIFGIQKPHTLTLISLSVFGDIWLTVWIAVMVFVCSAFISETPVL
jgi:hypothetical protein